MADEKSIVKMNKMIQFILCLKAHGSCNQLQNNRNNYEFNYDLHNLSLIPVTISSGLLRWKLEIHMVVKNTPYPFILSPTVPYHYLFWVGEGEEASTPACFPLIILKCLKL